MEDLIRLIYKRVLRFNYTIKSRWEGDTFQIRLYKRMTYGDIGRIIHITPGPKGNKLEWTRLGKQWTVKDE